MPLTAFVTDGDQRPALTIVRALARQGVRVIVGAAQSSSLASASRYCAQHVTYPSPCEERSAFERFLRAFVERERVDVLLPVTDVTTHAVCANQSELARHTSLAVPPLEAFELVTDKARLTGYAERCGIAVPRTTLVDRGTLRTSDLEALEYPVVIKPVRSRLRTADGWTPASVHYADSPQAVVQLYHAHAYLRQHPSLIQQRIVGPGIGIFVLFDRGTLVAEFAHRRLREKPPSGGASVLSESVPVDPRLRDDACRLLGPIGWHGVAMMEYKQDPRTGRSFLMEINGRFWGSLELAVRSGVDFPFLAFALAQGRRPPVPPAYDVGVRNRWLFGDLDHLLLRTFRSRRALNLPDAMPSMLRTAIDFFTIAQPKLHYEVISASDWRPFRYEAAEYVRGLRDALTSCCRRRAGAADPVFAAEDR